MLRRLSVIAVITLLLLAALVALSDFAFLRSSAAQENPPVRIEVGGINAENFPTLTLLVNVWDEFDVPVPGLTTENFQITADGAVTPVVSVENITEDDLPISVVLVIDTSQSMLDEPLNDVKVAALAFLDKLAPNDEVALVDFDSTARVAVDFTTDRDVMRSAIEGLTADGRTALYDAVYEAARLAAASNNPRRFVVFLTDGNEYGGLSVMSPRDGMDLAVANHVPFYVFGLGFWLDAKYLNSLVVDSHGKVYLYPDSSTLAAAYEYMATYLRTQNVVTINSDLEPDGRTVDLVVTVDGVSETVPYTVPDLYPQLTFEGVPEEPFAEPVTITVQGSMPRGLGSQTVTIDDQPFDTVFGETGDNTAAAEIVLDPYAYAPGVEHSLDVSATDAMGGARAASVTFTVADLPPVFEIVGLDQDAFISTDSFGVSVNVTQAQQPVEHVEYRIDGQAVAEVTDPPYVMAIDVLPSGPGAHTFEVAVIDASGETVESRPFTVDQALFITPSPTPTDTPTFTPTYTPTSIPTYTPTSIPTDTPEPTASNTNTPESSPTIDREGTANALAMVQTSTAESWTDTPVPPTNTPKPTNTPRPTNTSEPSSTPEPTRDIRATADAMSTSVAETATATALVQPTADLQATANMMAFMLTSTATTWTDTPEPTATDEPTEEPTEEPTATEEPTEEPTATVEPTEEPTATEEPTEESTEEPTAIPTATTRPEPAETEVSEEDGTELTDYWPLCLGGLIVLVVLYWVLSAGRRKRTQSGG